MQSHDSVITKIVENEKDIAGMIAYYSYKDHKVRFCQSIKKEHNRSPTEDELNIFLLSIDDNYIDKLRIQANRFLKIFVEESAEEIIKNEVKKANDEIEKTEAQNNKELKMALSVTKQPGYWYGVSQGIVASFCFVIIIGILAFMLSSVSIDVVGAAKWIGEHLSQLISQKQSPPP